MKFYQKALIATAVSTALAGPAFAGSAIFDINGAAGPGVSGVDIFKITSFDWAPGNLLIVGAADESLIALGADIPFVSQARISSINQANGGGNVPGISKQFTYQMKMFTNVDTQTYEPAAGAPAGHFFEIFYNPLQNSNDVTGCNFGTNQSAGCGVFPGVRILRGTAIMEAGTATSLGQTGTGTAGLDQSADTIDNDAGITTRNLSLGTFKVSVNVLSFDSSFFLSLVTSLDVDITHTETGGGAPFTGDPNPNDEVVGVAADAAFFGNGINDTGVGACNGVDPCGVQLSTDASSSIIGSVPEPGSLALLGLGLGAIGATLRRRRGAKA